MLLTLKKRLQLPWLKVLDKNAGGAIAAFRSLLVDEATDRLNPVLMTGATVLVDDDLLEIIVPRFRSWIEENGLEIEIEQEKKDGYSEIKGRGNQWKPRYYTK